MNWFRKSAEGKWLWPGFGENVRVLKWMFERCDGEEHAETTPIGFIPKPGALDLSGLSVSQKELAELFHIEKGEWRKEAEEAERYFQIFGSHLPQGIAQELAALKSRL